MNVDHSKELSESDLVCYDCAHDETLSHRIKKQGERGVCAVCGKHRKCVDVAAIGYWLKDALPLVLQPGRYGYRHDRFLGTAQFQGGHTLDYWLESLLGIDDERLVDALVGELCSLTISEVMDGEVDAPWDSEISYVMATPSTYEIEARWHDFEESIHHRFRFFNEEARTFLSALFADLPRYLSRKSPAWPPQAGPQAAATTPVVRQLDQGEGWPIYRARLAHGVEEFERFEANGANEMGPPPPRLASAGRMNPAGVPVFYGSSDRDTCVSELRPHMDSFVATAEFQLTEPVVVLDFRVLEDFFRAAPPSIFDQSYGPDIELHTFLKSLHRLIREPIRPGEEHRYLRTQVLAEYLATQHDPPIQGVVFSSAQNEDGTNLVLFPKRERRPATGAAPFDADEFPDIEDLQDVEAASTAKPPPTKWSAVTGFPLRIANDSLELHRVGAIKYEINQVRFRDDYEPDWMPEF